jgi:hypothetical protein
MALSLHAAIDGVVHQKLSDNQADAREDEREHLLHRLYTQVPGSHAPPCPISCPIVCSQRLRWYNLEGFGHNGDGRRVGQLGRGKCFEGARAEDRGDELIRRELPRLRPQGGEGSIAQRGLRRRTRLLYLDLL